MFRLNYIDHCHKYISIVCIWINLHKLDKYSDQCTLYTRARDKVYIYSTHDLYMISQDSLERKCLNMEFILDFYRWGN